MPSRVRSTPDGARTFNAGPAVGWPDEHPFHGNPVPERARVVIIGGGVIGCSVAYHLAHAGWTDVVLLERDRLTSGTTWHAAGLMTCFGSTSETTTGIRLYSRDLYARLEAETGQATGFKPVGLIEAAADADRLEEYRRVAAFQRHLGLEVEEISPSEMADLFPWARTDDLLAGFHVPGDGRVNPVDLTIALAKGARQLGVRIIEGVSVTDVLTGPRSRVDRRRAPTDGTTIECEYVVNCAGMWARELGARNGLVIPNQAAEHYYLITDTIDGLDPERADLRGPGVVRLLPRGGRRHDGRPVRAAGRAVAGRGHPAGLLVRQDPAGLGPDGARSWRRRWPACRSPSTSASARSSAGRSRSPPTSRRRSARRPASATTSSRPGMNSVGILSAGGLGRVLAHWIITGAPDVDVTGFNVDRFRPWQPDDAYRAARTTEILGTVYAAHTPGKQLRTARDRCSRPCTTGSSSRAATCARSPAGRARTGSPARASRRAPSRPGARAPWFTQWEAEHRAVREGVGLMDMSFMAKFRVQGPTPASCSTRSRPVP